MDGLPFDAFLDPGERLLWSGQPRQGLRLEASDCYQIPFSIVWCGFILLWEFAVLQAPHSAANGPHHAPTPAFVPWLFALWGVPFMIAGMHLLVGRFFYDAAVRKGTWYGLTDHRLVILKATFTTSVNSFDHATLTNLNLLERGNGTGDILFGTPYPAMPFQAMSWPGGRRRQVPGFYDLAGARNIYNDIRAVQSEARK